MTSQAQRIIDSAFQEYGDDRQKKIWQAWVKATPEIQSTATSEAALRSMPPGVEQATIYVLSQARCQVVSRLQQPNSDDEAKCLEDRRNLISSYLKIFNQPVTPIAN